MKIRWEEEIIFKDGSMVLCLPCNETLITMKFAFSLTQALFKWNLLTSSIIMTWEPVGYAESEAFPRSANSETPLRAQASSRQRAFQVI